MIHLKSVIYHPIFNTLSLLNNVHCHPRIFSKVKQGPSQSKQNWISVLLLKSSSRAEKKKAKSEPHNKIFPVHSISWLYTQPFNPVVSVLASALVMGNLRKLWLEENTIHKFYKFCRVKHVWAITTSQF